MEQEKKVLYRVRSSWEDADSQKGVFGILENAIKNCDHAGEGYYVFDDEGNIIYPESAVKDIEVEIFEEEPVIVKEWHSGDIASLHQGAVFATGSEIPPWFFRTKIYIRRIKPSGNIAIATSMKGDIDGLVKPEMLKEFDPNTVRLPTYEEMVSVKKGDLAIGDKVQVRRGAKYASGKVVPSAISDRPMYIMDMRDNGTAIIGKDPEGRINGIVNTADLSPYIEIINSIGKVRITQPTVNLRINPGTNFPVLGHAKHNQIFDIVETYNKWGLIPDKGWVYLPYTAKI